MKNTLQDAQDVFLGKVNQLFNKFGLNNIMAQLYALLYLSNKPLSLNDMVERLKISKGSASINMRALERYGAARRVWVKGSRKDYYEAETDIEKVAINSIKSMIRGRIDDMDDIIRASYSAINSFLPSSEKEKESIKVFRERLDTLLALQNKTKTMVKILNYNLLNTVFGVKAKAVKREKVLV